MSAENRADANTRPRPRVLYVDDQPGNLLLFKVAFKKSIDLVTASSAEEALRLLDAEEFPIVLSDQQMPGMKGTEFLAEVQRKHPDTIRMLLTAYTNFEDAVVAINKGQVSRFISKPWEAQDVLAALLNANELYWKVRENRTLTEQLLHRERLAAIGQVMSGLVHELGNVAAVLALVHDLKDLWQEGTDPTRELDTLVSGVDKLQVLLESIRLYSRGGDQMTVTKRPVDLGALIAKTLVLLRLFPQVKALQTLSFVPPAQPFIVAADDRKLQQVIINVVKNAAESCPHTTGVVRVTIESRDADLWIEVRDNGPGIPVAAAKKIWDGFYTTKGDKGTGLGLVMCRKIMQAHGGEIDFANNPEGGCTFALHLRRDA